MSTTTGIASVDGLLLGLSALTPEEWLRMGRVAQALGADRAEPAVAELLAEAFIVDRRLLLARWYALDAVETCVALAAQRYATGAGPLFAIARRAARRAVLAAIAREGLTAADVNVLWGPVRSVLGSPPDPPAPAPLRD